MVIDISLDHLKEDEVALILGVLERDAKIQKQEDERKRRLRKSIVGERVPGKRLSVKIRTGEWMEDMMAPSRAIKRRGTEIVRASIRRKASIKQTRNANSSTPREETDPSKQDELDGNVEITSPRHETTKPDAEDKAETSSSEKSSLRKTTIRRKKVTPQNQDKQVKLDSERTKEFVYEQTSIESTDGIPATQVDVNVIPTVVVQSDEETEKEEVINVAQPVEVTVITDDAEPEAQSYNSGDFSSSAKFESYHHTDERNLFSDEDQTGEDKVDEEDKKQDKEEPLKVVKKVKVIRRIGSSRRKVGKIFDDSSRDTLFNAPEENYQVVDVEEVVADKTVEAVVAIDSNVPDVPSNKKEGSEQLETTQPITNMPTDDAYPEILVAEAENKVDDSVVMSSILGKVANKYENLVNEEKHEITNVVADTEKHESRGRTDDKMFDQNVFDKTETAEDLTSETEKHHAALVDDIPYSPEPKLDLGLSEVLDTITEKYDYMSTEVKEALTVIANDTQLLSTRDDSQDVVTVETELKSKLPLSVRDDVQYVVTVEPELKSKLPLSFRDDIQGAVTVEPELKSKLPLSFRDDIQDVVPVEQELKSKFQEDAAQELELRDQIATLAADNKPAGQIPEAHFHTQNIATPSVDNLIDDVLVAAQITPKESEDEEGKGEENKMDEPERKVVKKVIKKIKADKNEEEHGSTKSETVKENDENVEGSPAVLSKFSRKKAVRRKVIKKAPAPSE